jgi:hypothetical protein
MGNFVCAARTSEGTTAARRPSERSMRVRNVVVSVYRGEIRTADHTGNNLSMLNQRKRDRILLPPEKSFGSVHGIECEETSVWSTAAPVDCCEHFVLTNWAEGACHRLDHTCAQSGTFGRAKRVSFLFTNERDSGER